LFCHKKDSAVAKGKKEKRQAPPPTPPKANLWDQPPEPKTGDAKEETIFAAIGRALSAWEEFEHSMANLFAQFLRVDTDDLPAVRAYGSVISFQGRASMVSAAAEAYFFENPEPTLQSRVEDLLKLAKGLSARRNEIAHGIVRNIQVPGQPIVIPNGPMFRPLVKWGFGLVPSFYSTNKTSLAEGETLLSGIRRQPKYTYTSHELVSFTAKFFTLNSQTIQLGTALYQHGIRPRG
jgi:hypothetical protein